MFPEILWPKPLGRLHVHESPCVQKVGWVIVDDPRITSWGSGLLPTYHISLMITHFFLLFKSLLKSIYQVLMYFNCPFI